MKGKRRFGFIFPNHVMTGLLVFAGLAFVFVLVLASESQEALISLSPKVELIGSISGLSSTGFTPYCNDELKEAEDSCMNAENDCSNTAIKCQQYSVCKVASIKCATYLPSTSYSDCTNLNRCFDRQGLACGYHWDESFSNCKPSISLCPQVSDWDCQSGLQSNVCNWVDVCDSSRLTCKDKIDKLDSCLARNPTLNVNKPVVPQMTYCTQAKC